MRFIPSAASALVASLLVKDVVAFGAHRAHRQFHEKREDLLDKRAEVIVTEEDFVSIEEIVYVYEYPGQAPSRVTSLVTSTSTLTLYSTVTPASSKVPATTSTTPVAATTAPAAAKVAAPAVVSSSPVAVAASSSAPIAEAVLLQKSTPVVAAAPTTLAVVAKPTTTAVAVPVPATTSASAAVPSTPTTSGGSKRGLAYNDASLGSAFKGSKVNWGYNWISSSDGLSSDFEYVPMLHCTSSDFTNSWSSDANKAIAAGSTHLLAMNEPDIPSQCNIGVDASISAYKQYMQPFAGKAKLGSVAVSNAGAPGGLTYLSSFVNGCSGCTIDFVVVHWYETASNVEYFKTFLQDAYTAGGNKPVWLTEFGAFGSDSEINTFLQTVLPWMDAQPWIERYSYFMASTGLLLTSSTQLSTYGSTFASL